MALKRKSFFWLVPLFLLLILAARGYYLYNKPHASVAGAAAAFSIDADSLFLQFRRDEQGADQKYLNKVIVVRGKLAGIQRSGASEIWILSAQPVTSPGGNDYGGINCQLFSTDKVSTSGPRPGDMITIKGRCTGFLMDVELADCVPLK